MKKILIALMVFTCILVTNCIPAYAENSSNIINGPNTAEEDLSPDYDIFFDYMDTVLNTDTQTSLTDEDIDYSRALKIYTDINIFEEEELNIEKLREQLKTATNVYDLPVYRDEKTIYFNIAKGLPLDEELRDSGVFTDEDIEYIEYTEGRWCVGAGSILDYEYNYIEAIEEMLAYNGIEDSDVYVVGGAGNGLNIIAVIFEENGDVEFNIINGFKGFAENEEPVGEIDRDYTLYSYEEMKALAERGGEILPDQYGAGGVNFEQEESKNYTQYILVGAGAVLVAAGITLSIILVKNKKERIPQK